MSIKTALRQTRVVTFAALVAGLWLLLSWLRVFETIDWSNTTALGQGAVAGVIGLLVMAITLGFLFVLAGELGDVAPGPNQWPPSE